MKNRIFCLLGVSMIALTPGISQASIPDLRDVVRSTGGDIVHNTFGNCVRTRWLGARDACAAEPRAEISREERTLYFDFNKFSLTQETVRKLDSLAGKLKSDNQVREAQIVGYADRIGTESYNQRLSQRRAENVRSYLVSRGFVKSRVVETRWLGETVPVTQCPDTLSRTELIQCLSKDRRVEVEIEYLPQ